MLLIDGISRGVRCENVSCVIQDYESAFELLTQLVIEDWILEYAVIVDNGDSIAIPVEAFDGQPIQVHIQALQQEWKQILSARPKPFNQLGNTQLNSHFRRSDTDSGCVLSSYLEKMIFLLGTGKRNVMKKRPEELRLHVSSRYVLRFETYKKIYQKAKKNWQRL